MSGVVTLSVEVELGWGVHDVGEYGHLSEDGGAERRYLRHLLDACDEFDVPITFDVVGHLCESTCDGDHDGPHDEGWFDVDPGTDASVDPLFYAPDAVKEILSRPTDHELCTHSYSHVRCDLVAPETVAWELERAQSQLRSLTGSRTDSLVPPRHGPPPLDVCRQAGIEVVRQCRDTSDAGRLQRGRELLVGPPPAFEPALVDGVVETYCTTYPSLPSSALPAGQRPAPPPFRAIPVRVRQALQRRYLRRGIDAAAESDGHCHLWSHCYDLANEYQWPVVRSFVRDLAARRDRGEVEVCTMARLGDRVHTTADRAAREGARARLD